MTVPAPLVSVNLVTYNHERYILPAIRSVLDQSFSNLELVVVNDGSTDCTRQQIDTVNDPRMVVIHQPNQGPAAATNRGLATCRGKFVALMSGDDLCHLDRIARQLEVYGRGPARVLFSAVDFIDDEGRPLPGAHFAAGSFVQENLGRPRILERLFRVGNYFNSITTFAEKAILLDGGGYDPSLLQMQDFELWVRLVKKYDLEIMADQLVHYRIRGNNENLSSPEPDKQIASLNEHHLVMRRFFDGLPLDLFRSAFSDQLQFSAAATPVELAFEQAQLYLKSPHALNRLIALEKLSGLLAEPASAAEVLACYDFGPPQFFGLLRAVNVLNLFAGHESSLFLDTGNGYNAQEQLVTRANLCAREFSVTFRLPAGPAVRALRWDPMEGRTCRVRVEEVTYHDARGAVHAVAPATLKSNGTALADGTVAFETMDPMFFLPISGNVARLSIRGTWEHDEPAQAFQRFQSRLSVAQQMVAQQGAALAEMERTVRRLSRWRSLSPLRSLGRYVKRLRAGG